MALRSLPAPEDLGLNPVICLLNTVKTKNRIQCDVEWYRSEEGKGSLEKRILGLAEALFSSLGPQEEQRRTARQRRPTQPPPRYSYLLYSLHPGITTHYTASTQVYIATT